MLLIVYNGLRVLTYVSVSQWRSQKIGLGGGTTLKNNLKKEALV